MNDERDLKVRHEKEGDDDCLGDNSASLSLLTHLLKCKDKDPAQTAPICQICRAHTENEMLAAFQSSVPIMWSARKRNGSEDKCLPTEEPEHTSMFKVDFL